MVALGWVGSGRFWLGWLVDETDLTSLGASLSSQIRLARSGRKCKVFARNGKHWPHGILFEDSLSGWF